MPGLERLHGVHRVLDPQVVTSLGEYREMAGPSAIDAARSVDPEAIISLVTDAGLRGRGGSGFPTGLKWSTVSAAESLAESTTVVVNAAEGEPGTFKDRSILRRNPYRMLEGAAIAAYAVGANAIRIGVKATFVREIRRVDTAITEALEAGWFDGIDVKMVLGAGYLFGEETAMLEVIEGRQPFPRVAPPFRRGVDEDDINRNASRIQMAGTGGTTEPPALVDNVETLSNVPLIVANGAEWFRSVGTSASPGTIVVTITGDTERAGVAEVPMGTTLREAIDLIGWGVRAGREVGVVISGTANALMGPKALDVPLTYEDMAAAGYGLGSAGFIVFDDRTDPVAVAQGISHFLAVESCGQCEPCKLDGTELSLLLARLARSAASEDDIAEIRRRQATVSIGARCNLARQQEAVVGSLLGSFTERVKGHRMDGPAAELQPVDSIPLIAPIENLVGGRAILDQTQAVKQPDWSYGQADSGTMPAALYGNAPFVITEPVIHERQRLWPVETDSDRIHPFDEIDDAHSHIDELLHGLMHADTSDAKSSLDALAHVLAVHLDVTQRILYPTLRRHCGADGDELADQALQSEARLKATVDALGAQADSVDAEAVRRVARELQAHEETEQRIFEMLNEVLDEQDKKLLLDALSEADETSQV